MEIPEGLVFPPQNLKSAVPTPNTREIISLKKPNIWLDILDDLGSDNDVCLAWGDHVAALEIANAGIGVCLPDSPPREMQLQLTD